MTTASNACSMMRLIPKTTAQGTRNGTLDGVERVFSTAGKMYDDLKKSAKDDTLLSTPSIIAAFSCD